MRCLRQERQGRRLHEVPVAPRVQASRSSFLLFGVALGVGALHPVLWLGPWIAIAALAFAITTAPSRARALAWFVVGRLIGQAIWLHWSFAMTNVFFGTGVRASALGLGFIVLQALPTLAMVAAGVAFFWGRPRVRFWLPVAWTLGEIAQERVTHVATQWLAYELALEPVKRALHHVGPWPTTIGCLFVAASIGEAIARRAAFVAAPAAALIVASFLLAPLPALDARLVEKIGVVHMTSELEPPVLPGGLELVVWPETALAEQPPIGEGPLRDGPVLDVARGGPQVSHLAGVLTRLVQGKQNSVVATNDRGAITASRAKRVLFPVTEQRYLGVGDNHFRAGKRPPLLEVAGRKVIPLVCYEYMTRSLIAEGKAAGGELVAIVAGDTYQAHNPIAFAEVLAHVRLRAVEFGLPVVYASRGSRSFILGPDGTVLAVSEDDRSGVLSWTRGGGAEDDRSAPVPLVDVVFSQASPYLRPDCPQGRCRFHRVESFRCPRDPAPTLVLAGHAAPPMYLGKTAAAIGEVARCFHPELLVIDACFGASAELLDAIAARVDTLVVAPPAFVDIAGLSYDAAFFEPGPLEARAAAARAPSTAALLRWRPTTAALNRARASVEGLDTKSLQARVRNWNPTLVSFEVEAGQEALFAADWRKLTPAQP